MLHYIYIDFTQTIIVILTSIVYVFIKEYQYISKVKCPLNVVEYTTRYQAGLCP